VRKKPRHSAYRKPANKFLAYSYLQTRSGSISAFILAMNDLLFILRPTKDVPWIDPVHTVLNLLRFPLQRILRPALQSYRLAVGLGLAGRGKVGGAAGECNSTQCEKPQALSFPPSMELLLQPHYSVPVS
jgi:hypothetical protein